MRKGCGLEYCEKLRVLDLSFNALSSEKEFKVFAAMPSLQELSLEGNPFDFEYRPHVIYATRHLKVGK